MGSSSVRPPAAEVVPRLQVRDPDAWLKALAVIVIAFCALQILLFSFGRDQSIYAMVGQGILRGQMPYRDLWDFKPPGIFFVYALSQAIFGHSMVSIRLVEVMGLVACVFGFMRLGENFFERRIIGLVAAAIAALIHSQLEFWHTGQPETFGGYLTIAALVLTTTDFAEKRRVLIWLSVGALFGCAFLLKPPLGGGALVCAAYLAKREQLRTNKSQSAVLAVAIMAAASFVPILLTFGWFWLRGAWSDTLWTLGEFTPGYTTLSWDGREAPEMLYYAIEEVFFRFSALAAAGVVAAASISPLHSREREGLFLLLGVIAIQIAGIAMQGKFFPYHYAATLPLISLVAGLGFYKLWRRCLAAGVGGVLAFCSFVVIVVIMRQAVRDLPQDYFVRSWIRIHHLLRVDPWRSRDAVDRELYRVADFNLAADRDVAFEVRERTGSEDKIFVWGFEPAIYWFSEREPASRFIYNVAQRTDWERSYARRELMNDLTKNHPAIIIVQRNDVFPSVTGRASDSKHELQTFPELASYIEGGYEPVKNLEDFEIYERRSKP